MSEPVAVTNKDGQSCKPNRTKPRKNRRPKFYKFCKLPYEIRNKIYEFLLINENLISLEVEPPTDFDGYPIPDGAIYYDEDMDDENDRRPLSLAGSNKVSITTDLLLVNKAIHDEAAPVLYGKNTFGFFGHYFWNDLCYFEDRLTDIAREHIHRIETGFPEIRRNTRGKKVISRFFDNSDGGPSVLNAFPNLKYLRLSVCQDLLPSDIELLQSLERIIEDVGHIVIDIGNSYIYYDLGGYDKRTNRVSSKAVEQMRDWRWDVRGNFELVDQKHEFVDELKWADWLYKNEQQGLRHGYLSQADLFESPFCGGFFDFLVSQGLLDMDDLELSDNSRGEWETESGEDDL